MLVIVSDLHLNDKTTGSPLDPGAFQIFAERLHETAVRASWRADGSYRPIERVDLVLLGDVLDLTGTTHWATSDVRPWSDTSAPRVADAVSSIVDNILVQNRDACDVLRTISTDGAIGIPPATQNGQPAYDAAGVPVAVDSPRPTPDRGRRDRAGAGARGSCVKSRSTGRPPPLVTHHHWPYTTTGGRGGPACIPGRQRGRQPWQRSRRWVAPPSRRQQACCVIQHRSSTNSSNACGLMLRQVVPSVRWRS